MLYIVIHLLVTLFWREKIKNKYIQQKLLRHIQS